MMLFEKVDINYFDNNLLYGKALIWSVCVCMSARVRTSVIHCIKSHIYLYS